MIGKIGMTPAFKGTIKVLVYDKYDGGGMISRIDTKDIKVINGYNADYSQIITKNREVLLVPKTYATKKDIIAAYTAAKNADVEIDASNEARD